METVSKTKISDIDEFSKLFKVNIPLKKEFDYYIETLRKSKEYSVSLSEENLEKFAAFERWVINETDSGNVRSYKMKSLDILKAYLLQTRAYEKLQNCVFPKGQVFQRDLTNQVEDNEILVSLDFKSANYSVLKSFDESDELKGDWSGLCKFLNIHDVLASSKSFRQLVFGNTNPKRLQTMQHYKIMQVKECLQNFVKDEQYVFISHDEIIFKLDKSIGSLNAAFDAASRLVGMPIRCTFFSTKKIKKNTFVKTVYTSFSDLYYKFEEKYRTLHGVPGNKFYMYFKKYILEEPLREIDLQFHTDDELCQWIDEDSGKRFSKIPHYEKPEVIVTLKSARRNYSYLWDNMTKITPSVSDEEKRRIIEIVAGSCKHCFQEPSGCNCWNDD